MATSPVTQRGFFKIGARALLVICALSGAAGAQITDREPRYVITGQVTDPDQLRPEEAILMLGHGENGSFSSVPVRVDADGSFVTSKVRPGTYVLQVGTPHSATKPGSTIGLSIVTVSNADVSGVTVAVRRDTALTGTFRMESDNPNAEWPTHIVVNALLAIPGAPYLGSTLAEGAPRGTFILRNAFGPRVLRAGYQLAPGSKWWPSRVLLDGEDITNVPTDFSEHEGGRLELSFTQHPAQIAGSVTDAEGQPVRAPWILVWAADPTLRENWATTYEAIQGDTNGRFAFVMPPGQYVVRAVPLATFASGNEARRKMRRFAPGGVPVDVKDRQVTRVNLTLQDR